MKLEVDGKLETHYLDNTPDSMGVYSINQEVIISVIVNKFIVIKIDLKNEDLMQKVKEGKSWTLEFNFNNQDYSFEIGWSNKKLAILYTEDEKILNIAINKYILENTLLEKTIEKGILNKI